MIRNRKTVIASTAALVLWWVVIPLYTYRDGTAIHVESTVIREPFLAGDDLVYNWSGIVVQACPIEVRRFFVDSKNVVTHLTALSFGPDELGPKDLERRVPVPLRMAEGPANYYAVEYPQCTLLQRLFRPAVPYPPVPFIVTR